MSSNVRTRISGPPRARRLKVETACTRCRRRKIKCNGGRPACSNCEKRPALRESCTYVSPQAACPSQVTEPRRRQPERPDDHHVREAQCVGVPGVFAGGVNAAVDARLGLPSGERPNLIPMTDAPLFGSLQLSPDAAAQDRRRDNALPPRRVADDLVDMYWRQLQPLEPFLDQESFTRSYQALFNGQSVGGDENVFISTLNIVFALSTQLQEGLQPAQRNEMSTAYFQRAWALLRPEAIIWEPGSPELVRCLLLMGRYLQCTNNRHQTWMIVGSAVRIAQSLGLYLPETTSGNRGGIRRQIAQCCVFMDRVISWALGRTSMLSSCGVLPEEHHEQQGGTGDPDKDTDSYLEHYFTRTLEIYEISNHTVMSQLSTFIKNPLDKLDLPRLYQDHDYLGTALQIDGCLTRWEESIIPPLRLDMPAPAQAQKGTSHALSHDLAAQRLVLRLRLLHGRIGLFRPMLARLCLCPPQSNAPTPSDQSLGSRVLKDCASICIENAQAMIDLINEHYLNQTSGKTGRIPILPWWHRIHYLHTGAMILIAAMLRADLFTPAVSASWNTAMTALRAHQHLCAYVQQCVATFETLSRKISDTHHTHHHHMHGTGSGGEQAPGPADAATWNAYFQDIFQDMGFDADSFLFPLEDMSWLGGLEATL